MPESHENGRLPLGCRAIRRFRSPAVRTQQDMGTPGARVINLGDPAGGPVGPGTSDDQPVRWWLVSAGGLDHASGAVGERRGDRPRHTRQSDSKQFRGVAQPQRSRRRRRDFRERDQGSRLPLGGELGLLSRRLLRCRRAALGGFVWRDGRMSPLPTLGGDNGFATGVNNRSEIVGWAENETHDPTCDEFTNTGQVLQFEAVMWVPGRDDGGAGTDSGYRAIELPALPRRPRRRGHRHQSVG